MRGVWGGNRGWVPVESLDDSTREGRTMAARSGGYYGTAFKGDRGVTQGDPLSPTLFNVVVDAVVRHWLEGLQAEPPW